MFARLFVCNQVNDISMETKRKELYEAPSTMVFEVAQEGVICASGDPEFNVGDPLFTGFGDEEEM